MEPKIIDHPGAGKIQEMTLDQYLSQLSADHLARKQLDEIRSQALKAVEFSTQLVEAKEKIMDLQNKLILGIAPQPNIYTGTPPTVFTLDPLGPPTKVQENPNVPLVPFVPRESHPKAACPTCGKMVTTSPGGWASHQRSHPDNKAPRPTL